MPNPPAAPNPYKILVSKITRELSELEFFIKRRTAEGYWNIGRYIHEHLLAHQDRAKYGATLYQRLAKDVDKDPTTLSRAVQFYRAYPILAERQELTWEHYRSLITIKDDKERKKLESQVIREDWNSTKLREYLSVKRGLDDPDNGSKPVVQLVFTRGRLHTYRIIKANKPLARKSPLVLDLGFRLQHVIPAAAPQFKEGDMAELVLRDEKLAGARKVTVSQDELFTYQAQVDKIIDGDTLITSFDFKCDASLSQKLRLRGIDCPEIDTKEGKKAKRFVASRLKDCPFIVVKTYKDRTDRFDRYLADVFYLPFAADPAVVAAKNGTYLNQELLNKRLARPWP